MHQKVIESLVSVELLQFFLAHILLHICFLLFFVVVHHGIFQLKEKNKTL